MSGHSKWSTIKHKKAKTDSQRAAVFQKYSRELIVAARLGGADPAGNFRLRTAMEEKKAAWEVKLKKQKLQDFQTITLKELLIKVQVQAVLTIMKN